MPAAEPAFFTSKNIMQWLGSRCFYPPRSHRPSVKGAESRSDPRCQNPLEEVALKIREVSDFYGMVAEAPVYSHNRDLVAVEAVGERVWDGDFPDPEWGFGYRSRQAGEHNGYTWFHLPKSVVAKPAIFAARMARSNLATRWLLI